ncbi:MAG: CRISPR system precrRNA processing endoribonuclease RAMP protein Cas6 [Deltaproteobacteria bacterium]|nr:CRISPR system precrRNA processing endoribonuclease RAMP protein Cas6 [Deltaproteobacteria bacterium]
MNSKNSINSMDPINTNNDDCRDWERYSARQDTRMKMGGFVGKAEYRGELGEFLSMISLGEKVHVGKGTGFGLGRYQIDTS